MCNTNTDPQEYKSFRDILYWHGLFAFIGYYLLRPLDWITPTRLWSKLAKLSFLRKWLWDGTYQKSVSWWQDLCVIVHVYLVYLLIKVSLNNSPCMNTVLHIIVWYFLVDILAYHIRVLWFDDLAPREPAKKRMVWSHRRIFFQAVVNFGETMCLFAILYHKYLPEQSFRALLKNSFTIATSLSSPCAISDAVPFLIVALQIAVSIFFLVVAISVIASVGYARPELGKTFDDQRDRKA